VIKGGGKSTLCRTVTGGGRDLKIGQKKKIIRKEFFSASFGTAVLREVSKTEESQKLSYLGDPDP